MLISMSDKLADWLVFQRNVSYHIITVSHPLNSSMQFVYVRVAVVIAPRTKFIDYLSGEIASLFHPVDNV